MPYSVEFQATANDDMGRLDTAINRRVRSRLDELAANADAIQYRALAGPLRGLFRLRVANYRCCTRWIGKAEGSSSVR